LRFGLVGRFALVVFPSKATNRLMFNSQLARMKQREDRNHCERDNSFGRKQGQRVWRRDGDKRGKQFQRQFCAHRSHRGRHRLYDTSLSPLLIFSGKPPHEVFGANAFSKSVMKARLPNRAFTSPAKRSPAMDGTLSRDYDHALG
jgi:hypothetical protein